MSLFQAAVGSRKTWDQVLQDFISSIFVVVIIIVIVHWTMTNVLLIVIVI